MISRCVIGESSAVTPVGAGPQHHDTGKVKSQARSTATTLPVTGAVGIEPLGQGESVHADELMPNVDGEADADTDLVGPLGVGRRDHQIVDDPARPTERGVL